MNRMAIQYYVTPADLLFGVKLWNSFSLAQIRRWSLREVTGRWVVISAVLTSGIGSISNASFSIPSADLFSFSLATKRQTA